jgi:uncharacterized protein (DUF2249 family)
MMNDSPMPLKRQLRYQKECRDNWKENSAKKQKKIREQTQTIRNLTNSRQNWRSRAQKAEQQLQDALLRIQELEQQLADSESNQDSSPDHKDDHDHGDDDDHPLPIPNHTYNTSTISLAVQQFLHTGHSYRGIDQTFDLLSSYCSLGTPHYSTIKSWVERLGLYQLQLPKDKRDDWLFIADLTIQLGHLKALVIYGIPQSLWLHHILPHKRALTHRDGDILALEVTHSASGEWIFSILDSLSQKIGVPLQIIADHAPNLTKGIQLFQAKYSRTVFTYDVTHAVANLLKKELFSNSTFQNFLSDCHRCRLQVLRTEFAFAAPPPQRSQCRFFNLQPLIRWAFQLLQHSPSFFYQLLPPYSFSHISSRFYAKFDWLSSYLEPLPIWQFIFNMTRSLEIQIKSLGLNSDSLRLFHKHLSSQNLPSSLFPFRDKLLAYLEHEVSLISSDPLLGSSDVLESIFGRYKFFCQRCPLNELRSMILTIPLATIDFSHSFIKEALSTVRMSDLSEWVKQTFGRSMLSQRKLFWQNKRQFVI